MSLTIEKNKPFVHENTSYSGADITATLTIAPSDGITGGMCLLGDIQTLSYSLHMEREAVRGLGNINVKDYTNGPRTIAGSLVFAVFNRHVIYRIIESTGIDKKHVLTDELPPFDITITAESEYGYRSVMRILGIRLVNEGKVFSINDIYTENTYQYYARDIDYLDTESEKSISIGDSANAAFKEEKEEDHLYEGAPLLDNAYLNLISTTSSIDGAKGNAYFTLNRAMSNSDYHVDIMLKSEDEIKVIKSYDLTMDTVDLIAYLDEGSYNAVLTSSNAEKELSTLYFAIDTIDSKSTALNSPMVTKITNSSLKGFNQDERAIEVYYKNSENELKSVEIEKDNTFEITSLDSYSDYKIFVMDRKGASSAPVTVTTEMDFNIAPYAAFREFIITNSFIFKDYYVYFEKIYQKLLEVARLDNSKLTIAKYINQLKTLNFDVPTNVLDYYVKQANICEIYSKIGKEKYTLVVRDFYNNTLNAGKNCFDICLLSQDNKQTISLNKMNENSDYSFLAKQGFYYLIKTTENNRIEQIEYYIASEETNAFFKIDSHDDSYLSDEYEAFYHRTYNYTFNKTKHENIDAFLSTTVGETGVALIYENTDDSRIYFSVYSPSKTNIPYSVVFDTIHTVFSPSSAKVKYLLNGESAFSIPYVNSYINDKEKYFVYLQDEDGAIISKSLLIYIEDMKLSTLQKELIYNEIGSLENKLQHYIERNCESEYLNIETIIDATISDVIGENLNTETKCNYIQKLVDLKNQNIYKIELLSQKNIKVAFSLDDLVITGPYSDYHMIIDSFDGKNLKKSWCHDFSGEKSIPYDELSQYVSIYFEKQNFVSKAVLIDIHNKIVRR